MDADGCTFLLAYAVTLEGPNIGCTRPPLEDLYGCTRPPLEDLYGCTRPPLEDLHGCTLPPLEDLYGCTLPPLEDLYGCTLPPLEDLYGCTLPPLEDLHGRTLPPLEDLHGCTLPPLEDLYGFIPVSLGFNIDTRDPGIYTGQRKDFFGYKVLQFMSGTNKGIVVTAPLFNGSGAVCVPETLQDKHCFSRGEISHKNSSIPIKHFGLSIAEDSLRSQFTVCSPSVVHECNENSYLNSVCFTLTHTLQEISVFTPSFQECTKKTVDLVFLFDGSRSMSEDEFNKNKAFIVDIMKSLRNTSIKFAAVQFSTNYRKVFDFSDYQAGNALAELDTESHMKGLTNTHGALKFVLEQILENPGAGASPNATQVLVMITDGDPSDTDSHGIIQRYDDKSIIRVVIGVKHVELKRFMNIASNPKEKNIFKIENYDGLTGILENLQKRIFGMEGFKVARAGNMTNEMSQAGFSAAFYKDTLILGSVGSNSWRGSLQESPQQKPTQMTDPLMQMDSYMGYSTCVGEKDKARLYFTGAPRFEHIGRVVLFSGDGEEWTVAQTINGHQIGSYFGAELCAVDVNSDGSTDFLLVGAPLFYWPQDRGEGQIYVYRLTEEIKLRSELNVTVSSMGRFGTSISSLADVNGDELRDVAVGAPLEDDNRGAVYLFLGDRQRGIRCTFSQRITGRELDLGLRFFGQAIDGRIDLGQDGLLDMVVGSQGMAVVLRSRPVFSVQVHLSFRPEQVRTDKIDCLGNTGGHLPTVTLTACFHVVETTRSKAEVQSSALNISYMLNVDPTRQTHRGFFSQNDHKARTLTSALELRNEDTCSDHTLYIPNCVRDSLSPIVIKLNFSQDASQRAAAVLSVDSKRQAVAEVPFEKQCMKNDTCIAELEVDFNFTTSTLLVAEDNYFSLSVKLSNHGDDSYNTVLSVHYPPGLSFSRMTLTEATRPTLSVCRDVDPVRTACGVSLPVYRGGSAASFKIGFLITTKHEWNETVSFTVSGSSDNTNSTRMNSLTKSIQVQFEIKMVVTVKQGTISYLNFTTEDAAPKKMVAIYKVENPGLKAFPVSVSLFFPTRLEHKFEMKNYQVLVKQNQTRCAASTDMKSEYCSTEKYCKIVACDSFILDKESTTEFLFSGDVHFRDLKQNAANIAFLKRYTGDGAEVKFKSFLHVAYDKQRYVLDSHKEEKAAELGWRDSDPTFKSTEVRVELIFLADQRLIILTGAGIGFLILILITILMLKSGCFKRKTLEYYKEQEESAARQNGRLSPAHRSSDPPSEEALLDGGGTGRVG
ncbi:integrin alpha-D [Brachionichthys hirsutus]|uniref:integrin alpha-D n=1 Tax=Brachionichthys hirsutus TaxID=412623 RepID=UPI003604AD50